MVGVMHTMDTDNAFLATLECKSANRYVSSYASSQYIRDSYLTEDNTMEEIHTCAFVHKVQTHEKDSPTYEEILSGLEEEKQLWEDTMVQ